MANILIVDDDLDIAEAFGDVLRAEGHNVHTAHSGVGGLSSLRGGLPLPSVIVLDVEMPVLNGPDMAHEMLLHDAGEEKVPIILVSARNDLSEIAERMGTPYFLSKPCDIKDLVAVLNRALREHQAPASA
jgi:DNA-binding response OmpR family regulator